MLLSEAIERVRTMVDADSFGEDGDRWTSAEVQQKLKFALEAACTLYAGSGGQRLDQTVDIDGNSSGVVSLTSQKPIQIQSVRVQYGNLWIPVPAVAAGQLSMQASQVHTVRVRYVGTPTFPSETTDEILYGNQTSWELMDELICLQAARALLAKDGEIDQSLEMQAKEALQMMLSNEHTLKVFDYPIGLPGDFSPGYFGRGALVHDYSPYSLTLGYR